MFTWWKDGNAAARRAAIAAALGWMLDAFDVMLYSLVVQGVMLDLKFDAAAGGRLQSFTLIAGAASGLAFGVLADRRGRTRALILSLLFYSIFTAACGFSRTFAELAIFRIGLGIGMGGEWASGAALVSETWPERSRGRALAFVQSAWAIGYALAALASWLIQSVCGLNWRAVFFAGIAPALFALWIRRKVEEPKAWIRSRRNRGKEVENENENDLGKSFVNGGKIGADQIDKGRLVGITVALTLMNACTMFAWWGFNTWVPSYLKAPPEKGGVGLSAGIMTVLLVSSQAGMWLGYVSFGYLADWIGRKRAYVGYLLLAAILFWAYTSTRNVTWLLLLGPFTAFFATGYFSGFGAVTADFYPTRIRATAQGFTYNAGRLASAAAPALVGSIADRHGYGAAISVMALAFVAAAAFWFFIPETMTAHSWRKAAQEPAR